MIVRQTTGYLPTIAACIVVVSVATAAAVRADERSETEQQLIADAADDSLDEFSLLEGALIASGVTDRQRVEQYCSEFGARIAGLLTECDDKPTDLAKPERIYRFLHSEFLTGEYRSTCTELDRTLDDGDYNCVTATILYNCICRVHGLSPVAVATNTHVRSRLLEGSAFEVETTCREWFDVVRRDPRTQELRMQRQVTRTLSDVELLGKIYYNRGVSLLENKAFGNAIALLRISRSLDPADAPTRENMAAGVNNWALAESDAGNFERAVELLQEGWKQFPEYATFPANDVHIHQQWAVALCEKHRFAEAMQALRAAHARRPEVALFDRGRLVVFAQWGASLLEAGDLDSATQLFEQAGGWFDNPSEIARYRSLAIQTAVERLADAGYNDQANRLVRWGLKVDPTDSLLQKAASDLTTANL